MNLKEFRKSLNLSQTEFAKGLCMSFRQYHRCEKANELNPQASKILYLMIELNNVHGFINDKVDCLKLKVDSKSKVSFLSSDLCEASKSIKDEIGEFFSKK